MKRYKERKIVIRLLVLLLILFGLSGCQSDSESEAPSTPEPPMEPSGLELMDFMGRSLFEVMQYFGDIVGIEADEMDDTPVVIFDTLQVRINAREEKIAGFTVDREKQTSLNQYRVSGVNFEMNNREVLEFLGEPVNGSRDELVYSENFYLWRKFSFNNKDQLEHMRVFYGFDQGDRIFNDWR